MQGPTAQQCFSAEQVLRYPTDSCRWSIEYFNRVEWTHARTALGHNHLYPPFTYHTHIPRKIVTYGVPLTTRVRSFVNIPQTYQENSTKTRNRNTHSKDRSLKKKKHEHKITTRNKRLKTNQHCLEAVYERVRTAPRTCFESRENHPQTKLKSKFIDQ